MQRNVRLRHPTANYEAASDFDYLMNYGSFVRYQGKIRTNGSAALQESSGSDATLTPSHSTRKLVALLGQMAQRVIG